MNIVIYTICKNEQDFAKRFAETTIGADNVIVFDTGSTDETINILSKYNHIQVHKHSFENFRFDTARNMALSLLQDNVDIAISMDMDDILLPNWRSTIESNWIIGQTTMLNYPYIHSWDDEEQTMPRLSIWGFKIHCPRSYTWEYPIHEVLTLKEKSIANEVVINDHIVEHHPDWKKEERLNRINIFEKFINEYINNPRMVHLYGRELLYKKSYHEAISWLKKYMDLTKAYED